MLGRSSQRRLPSSIPPSRRRVEDTSTGGSRRGADVVEPRLQLVGREAFVAVDHGGDQLARLDRHLGAVVTARQLVEISAHTVDELVDVLGEHPGHAAGCVGEDRSAGTLALADRTRFRSTRR